MPIVWEHTGDEKDKKKKAKQPRQPKPKQSALLRERAPKVEAIAPPPPVPASVPRRQLAPWKDLRAGLVQEYYDAYEFPPESGVTPAMIPSPADKIRLVKEELFSQHVMRSLRLFSPEALKTKASTIASVVMSSPPKDVRKFAELVNNLDSWIGGVDRFAGQDGMLTSARNFIWHIKDPGTRASADYVLDRVQKDLSDNAQQVFLSILQNPDQYIRYTSFSQDAATKTAEEYYNAHKDDAKYRDGEAQVMVEVTGADGKKQMLPKAWVDGLNLADSQREINGVTREEMAAALAEIESEFGLSFEQGTQDIPKLGKTNLVFSQVQDRDGTASSVDIKQGLWALMGIGKAGFFATPGLAPPDVSALERFVGSDFKENLLDTAGAFNKLMALPGEITGGATEAVMGNPAGRQAAMVLSGPVWADLNTYLGLMNKDIQKIPVAKIDPDDPDLPRTQQLLAVMALDPVSMSQWSLSEANKAVLKNLLPGDWTDEELSRLAESMTGLEMLLLGGKGSRALKAMKVAREADPALAASRLGLTEEGVAGYIKKVNPSIGELRPDANLVQRFLYRVEVYRHVNDIIDYHINRKVFEATAKGYDELIDDPHSTLNILFDEVEAMKRDSRKPMTRQEPKGSVDTSQVQARAMERYESSLPQPLAEILAETPREQMGARFIEYQTDARRINYEKARRGERMSRLEEEAEAVADDSSPADALEMADRERTARLIEAELQQERAAYAEFVARTAEREPVTVFPRRKVSRALGFLPLTGPERFFAKALDRISVKRFAKYLSDLRNRPNPWNRGLTEATGVRKWVQTWSDSLPEVPRLWNKNVPGAPEDWATHNAVTIRNYLSRYGFSESEIARFAGRMLEQKTPQDLYLFTREMLDAIAGKLRAKGVPETLINEATRAWENRPFKDRTDTWRYDLDRDQPVLGVINGFDNRGRPREWVPRPSRPTDFVGHVDLPSMDTVANAVSLWRRIERMGPSLGNKTFGQLTLGLVRQYNFIGTSVYKPMTLIFRLPATIQRIQFEQFFRVREFGTKYRFTSYMPGGVPVKDVGLRARMARVMGVDRTTSMFGDAFDGSSGVPDLGSAAHEIIGPTESVSGRTRTPATQWNQNRPSTPTVAYNGWMDEMVNVNRDFLQRRLVYNNLDVAATVDDIMHGQHWTSGQKAYFEAQLNLMRETYVANARTSGGSTALPSDRQLWTDLLDGHREYINTLTAGDPELLQLVLRGRVPSDRFRINDNTVDPVTGRSVIDEFEELQGRVDQIRDEVAHYQADRYAGRGDFDADALAASQQALYEARSRMRQLAREHPDAFREFGKGKLEPSSTNRGKWTGKIKENEGTRYLRRRHQAGEVDLPPEVSIGGAHDWRADDGFWANTRRAYHRAAYSPYRLMEVADRYQGRRPLYYQAAKEYYDAYRNMGYSHRKAKSLASMRAAEFTRDVLYDLSGRTSAQRAVKDIFWFAPAQQEVLTTWALNVPRQYGNMVAGWGMLGFKANAIYHILNGAGIIRKNAKGEDVIGLPFADEIIKFLGAPLDLSGVKRIELADMLSMKLKDFSIVGGGIGPGLATQDSAIILKLRDEQVAGMKELSEFLDGIGMTTGVTPNWVPLPQQAISLLEFATGKPASWASLSPWLVQDRWNRALWDARAYALVDMEKRNIVPPWEKEGLSDEEYTKQFIAWEREFLDTTDGFMNGALFTTFLSSVGLIARLRISSEEREAALAIKEKIQEHLPVITPGDNMQIRALEEDFLAKYPGAELFLVSPTIKTTKAGSSLLSRLDPSVTDEDAIDAYLTDKLNEQIRTLDKEEQIALAETFLARRVFATHLTERLSANNPTMDGFYMATHGAEKSAAYAVREEEEKRFFFLSKQALSEDPNRISPARIWEDVISNAKNDEDAPAETFAMFQVSEGLDALSLIASQVEGTGDAEMGKLWAAWYDIYDPDGIYGKPKTPWGQDIYWLGENVLEPYSKEVEPLYRAAEDIGDMGGNPSEQYDRIREISDKYYLSPQKYQGRDVPSPEEVFYGNKTAEQQEDWHVKKASQDLTWLTEFQLDKVFPQYKFPERTELLDAWRARDDLLEAETAGMSHSSLGYKAKAEQADRDKAAAAAVYGADGMNLWAVQNMLPVERIVAEGTVKAEGLSTYAAIARGYGDPPTIEDKVAFNLMLKMEVDNNPDGEIADALELIGGAVPKPGRSARTGGALVEYLFFDNSSGFVDPRISSIWQTDF